MQPAAVPASRRRPVSPSQYEGPVKRVRRDSSMDYTVPTLPVEFAWTLSQSSERSDDLEMGLDQPETQCMQTPLWHAQTPPGSSAEDDTDDDLQDMYIGAGVERLALSQAHLPRPASSNGRTPPEPALWPCLPAVAMFRAIRDGFSSVFAEDDDAADGGSAGGVVTEQPEPCLPIRPDPPGPQLQHQRRRHLQQQQQQRQHHQQQRYSHHHAHQLHVSHAHLMPQQLSPLHFAQHPHHQQHEHSPQPPILPLAEPGFLEPMENSDMFLLPPVDDALMFSQPSPDLLDPACMHPYPSHHVFMPNLTLQQSTFPFI